MRTHQEIDRRSLLLHRLISSRLRQRPELLGRVRQTIRRWSDAHPESTSYSEWSDLLAGDDVAEIVQILRSRDENAARLRQSSPFTGILSEEERLRVFRRYAVARD